MRKKLLINFSILLLIIIFGILYYRVSVYSYQTSEDLYGFPVPNNAQLVHDTEQSKGYDWERASFENGIPLSYKMVIKLEGWKKVKHGDGGHTNYTKGNYRIDVLSSTDYIQITKDM